MTRCYLALRTDEAILLVVIHLWWLYIYDCWKVLGIRYDWKQDRTDSWLEFKSLLKECETYRIYVSSLCKTVRIFMQLIPYMECQIHIMVAQRQTISVTLLWIILPESSTSYIQERHWGSFMSQEQLWSDLSFLISYSVSKPTLFVRTWKCWESTFMGFSFFPKSTRIIYSLEALKMLHCYSVLLYRPLNQWCFFLICLECLYYWKVWTQPSICFSSSEILLECSYAVCLSKYGLWKQRCWMHLSLKVYDNWKMSYTICCPFIKCSFNKFFIHISKSQGSDAFKVLLKIQNIMRFFSWFILVWIMLMLQEHAMESAQKGNSIKNKVLRFASLYQAKHLHPTEMGKLEPAGILECFSEHWAAEIDPIHSCQFWHNNWVQLWLTSNTSPTEINVAKWCQQCQGVLLTKTRTSKPRTVPVTQLHAVHCYFWKEPSLAHFSTSSCLPFIISHIATADWIVNHGKA